MKTKEEILKECGFVVTVHEEEIGLVTTAFIEPFMKAMEKYADEVSLGKTIQIHARDQQIEKYKELIEAQEKYIKKADSVMGNWECSHAELTNLRFIIGRLKTELGL